MTSSLRSYALKSAFAATALAAIAAGCGPKDGSAAYAEGNAAYAARDLVRAAKCFDESLKLTPGSADTWLMLARVRMEQGDMEGASAASAKASELAPGDADVVEIAGQIAYLQKDVAKAREAFATLARSEDAQARSRGYCSLGVMEMASIAGSGATADLGAARARVALLTAVRFDGRNACARYHLGRLYRDAFGYNEAALDQFELFVRLESRDGERVRSVQRRVIPELRDSIAKAAARRTGADRRDSAASAAALKKGDEAFAKGQFKTARLRYGEALQADVLSYQAALGLAKSWEKTDVTANGQAEALKCYKVAAQLRPSSYAALMATGNLAVKLGHHAAAVEAYSRAMAVKPSDISAIDGLIRSLRKCDKPKAASVYQDYRSALPATRR